MQIDNLNAISPRIAKIAAERRLEFQFVFPGQLLADFFDLVFVTDHDSKVTHVRRLRFFNFENCQELMFSQFEKRVAFALIELLEIENVFVKRDRFFDVVDFNRNVIAAVNFNLRPG